MSVNWTSTIAVAIAKNVLSRNKFSLLQWRVLIFFISPSSCFRAHQSRLKETPWKFSLFCNVPGFRECRENDFSRFNRFFSVRCGRILRERRLMLELLGLLGHSQGSLKGKTIFYASFLVSFYFVFFMFLLFWAIFFVFYINLCHFRGEKLHGDDVGVTSMVCEIQLNLSLLRILFKNNQI